MSSDNDTDTIFSLIQAIQESEKTPEIIEWMRTITDKQYDLVSLLIQTFMEQFDDIQLANSILIALKKLNDNVPEQVLPQMRENKQFPIAISQYITLTKIDNLVGEAFLLLIDIFSVTNFQSVTNEAFVQRLFDLLAVINDEDTFNAVVKIFITISYEQKVPQKNLVIKIATTHTDQRFFSETLLHLLNKNDPDMIIKALAFIKDVYQVQKNFFYSNDFKVLIDVCIRESNNTASDVLRERFIDVLLTLTNTDEYKKDLPRRNSIFQLVDTIQYSTVSVQSKQLSSQLKQSLEKCK